MSRCADVERTSIDLKCDPDSFPPDFCATFSAARRQNLTQGEIFVKDSPCPIFRINSSRFPRAKAGRALAEVFVARAEGVSSALEAWWRNPPRFEPRFGVRD